MEKPNKALFLDLDGTLISTLSGDEFPRNTKDWKINAKVADQAQKLRAKLNLLPIIVTNQGGIEAGYVRETAFLRKVKLVQAWLLTDHNLHVPWFYYCDKLDPNCFFRKPNPGMAYRAATQWSIILRHSYMVGDASGKKGDHSSDDRDFAHLAGIGTYYDVKQFLKLKI